MICLLCVRKSISKFVELFVAIEFMLRLNHLFLATTQLFYKSVLCRRSPAEGYRLAVRRQRQAWPSEYGANRTLRDDSEGAL